MIAMALANGPELLIADEPTTALDVTIQAQILDLLADLKRARGMSDAVHHPRPDHRARIADRVCVMKDGEIVETGPDREIFANPQHPYTRMLLAAEPKGGPTRCRRAREVVARDRGSAHLVPDPARPAARTVGHIKAVNDATLTVRAGETLGIVGESGSGKTTLALAIMRLISSEGRIVFLGRDIQGLAAPAAPLRRDMQIVFQDPFGSLSPRMTVEQIIAEGLGVHGVEPGRDRASWWPRSWRRSASTRR
jgi:microcin C transport system ATP-binding protein